MEMTRLPESKVFGVNVNQDSLFALFLDELLSVIDIYVGWKHNLERRRIAVYQTPDFAK